MEKIKVAAYCRVSTDKEDQINSLENQIAFFTDYINSNANWELYKVYYDEGISGTSVEKREQFNQMICDAESGKFKRIVTKEVSRFARNTVDTLSYVRNLKSINVGVTFLNDNIDTMATNDEFRLSIMSSIAQEESRKTSERVKWGQKRRMEQGVVFGRDMLGYKVKNGKMTIVPEEAEIVKMIYHKYLIEGKGTHIIAKELREEGISPMRVKQWSNTVILRVLKNEKYVGDLCQGKTYTPDFLTHKKKYNHNEDSMVYIKNHHEPIIDRETWDKTQEEVQRRSPSEECKSRYSNRYWCSGKLICGECQQRFIGRTKKLKSGGIYKAWRCNASANHGNRKTDKWGNIIGCDNGSINEKVLLNGVAYVLNMIQINKEQLISILTDNIKAIRNSTNINRINIDKIYASINEIEQLKTKLLDILVKNLISEDEFTKQKEVYDKAIAQKQKIIIEEENKHDIIERQAKEIEKYITAIRTMLDFSEPIEEICTEVLDKIVIYKDKEFEVFLNCLPTGVRLRYSASGKKDDYTIEYEVVSMDETNTLLVN